MIRTERRGEGEKIERKGKSYNLKGSKSKDILRDRRR